MFVCGHYRKEDEMCQDSQCVLGSVHESEPHLLLWLDTGLDWHSLGFLLAEWKAANRQCFN